MTAVPPPIVAKLIQQQENSNMRFAGRSGHVTGMVCQARGADIFACKAWLSYGGRRFHILLPNVLFKPNGHYTFPAPIEIP